MSYEYLYNLKCTTEDDVYKQVWSTTTPTVCPDNAGHTIDPNSLTISDSRLADAPINSNNRRFVVYDYDTGIMGPLAISGTGKVLKYDTNGKIKAEAADHYQILFGSDKYSGVEAKNSVYTSMGTFVFEGTEKTPMTNLKIVCYATDKLLNVRLVNYSNSGEVLFEKTGITNSVKELVSVDFVAALPTTESILEIDISYTNASGNQKPLIYSAILE